MAGRYGISFARTLIERGDYEEAVDEATRAIDAGDHGPEPLFDRATALDFLERHAEAVADLEKAIAQNRADKELDPFTLDDAFFSALLSMAKAEGVAGARTLERYAVTVPDGAHLEEARDWQKRLRGEMPSLLDKTKALDAP
jgi:tetratricopeptide (TPR) repeat protein